MKQNDQLLSGHSRDLAQTLAEKWNMPQEGQGVSVALVDGKLLQKHLLDN
jgi:hypothetical protein